MAVTILLCIGGFVVIYAQVDPLTRDFVGAPATATPTEEPRSSSSSGDRDDEGDDDRPVEPTEAPEQDAPTPTPDAADEPSPTPETFTPTHVSNTQTAVNFRAGPGTDAGIITTLPAGTPLRATGEEGTGSDGLVWLEFETEDGTTGWIREIDSVPQS